MYFGKTPTARGEWISSRFFGCQCHCCGCDWDGSKHCVQGGPWHVHFVVTACWLCFSDARTCIIITGDAQPLLVLIFWRSVRNWTRNAAWTLNHFTTQMVSVVWDRVPLCKSPISIPTSVYDQSCICFISQFTRHKLMKYSNAEQLCVEALANKHIPILIYVFDSNEACKVP